MNERRRRVFYTVCLCWGDKRHRIGKPIRVTSFSVWCRWINSYTCLDTDIETGRAWLDISDEIGLELLDEGTGIYEC